MYFTALFTSFLFAATALATPHPWAAPQASVAASSGGQEPNRTVQLPEHEEPTPVFQTACKCALPVVPMNLLSANEKCLMKTAAEMGCYISSNGGCPSPAPACGLGPLSGTPML